MPIIIPISGHIGFDVWPEDIRRELNAAKGEDVIFEISSGGGFISDGLEIFNLIHDYPGKTTARIIGMAASMASYIPLAADKVIAKSNAVFMIHGALMGVFGNEEEHRETADILGGLTNLLADIYVKKTGMSHAEISALLKKDSFFFGKEMLEAGFVDEIEEIEIPSTAEDRANLMLAAKANIQIGIEKVLASNPENARANMTRAAALLPTDPPKPAKVPVKPTPTQGETMNETEFLAFLETNPAAKAFYTGAMAYIKDVADSAPDPTALGLVDILALAPTAKTEHETALADSRKEVEAGKLTAETIKSVAAILGSAEYGASIKAAGIKVLSGEKDHSNFEDMVALADETAEQIKSLQADGEQGEDTPPGGADMGEESSINSPKHQANISTLKSQLNLSQPTA